MAGEEWKWSAWDRIDIEGDLTLREFLKYMDVRRLLDGLTIGCVVSIQASRLIWTNRSVERPSLTHHTARSHTPKHQHSNRSSSAWRCRCSRTASRSCTPPSPPARTSRPASPCASPRYIERPCCVCVYMCLFVRVCGVFCTVVMFGLQVIPVCFHPFTHH